MAEPRTTKAPRAPVVFLKPAVLFAIALAMGGCAALPADEQPIEPDRGGPGAAASRDVPPAPQPPPAQSSPDNAPASAKAPQPAAADAATAADVPPHKPDSPAASATQANSGALLARVEPALPAATEPAAPPAPPGDLWDRIRTGFRLPPIDSPLVAAHVRRFTSDPEYLARIFDRARLYLRHIVDEVEKRNMPLEIALLPAIESAYHPHAYSRARAMGLWQFIAPTARVYGVKVDWWYDGRRDVLVSTRAALDYLQKLHDDFNGDWFLALAAYNAGEGGIQRRINENRRRGRPTGYQDLRLVSETRHYVPKLMAFVSIVADPRAHGVTLPGIPDAPYFAAVDAGSQIDLTVVSQLAGLEMTELRKINPGFNRIATPPDGPHHILVPADRERPLVDGLSALPEDARVRWQRHHVRSGDTLGGIARRYGVSVQELQRANELRGTLIRAGRDLMIPISSQPFSLRTAQAATAQAVSLKRVTKSPDSGPAKVEHRVREGDTLWSIARRYDVHVAQLEQWNSINENDTLRVDQRLEIWTPTRVD